MKVAFSDEATVHSCGNGSHYNFRICGSENPHAVLESI
jgi:hypothetical protein